MAPLRSLITLGLALLTSACAQADTAHTPLAEAWSAGKAIVVTIDATPSDTDETYGDFAYYLNDFATNAGDDWAFFELDSQQTNPDIPIELNVTAPPYSVLFMKAGAPQGYLYPGPILEPQVYDFVQRQFEGKEVPEYLYQFAPDEVQVEMDEESGLFGVGLGP
ncbi:MAG: hypothetical protein MI794_05015 [Pseudomonadales bacterium]|nr:hypothetical protein [Pseudomonadales bacterium]